MAAALMKSISGIRGIVGETLTPEVIHRTGVAMARYTKRGTVVIGRDTRPTGTAIASGIQSTLLMAGCNVVDIGVVPTPTVQIMVEELRADGGIVISASHNPVQWNAFKLVSGSGSFLGPAEIKRFFAFMEQPFKFARWNGFGYLTINDDAELVHIERVLRVVDRDLIRKRGFTVVLDSVNGAGSMITPRLLSDLGCRVIPVNCEPDGMFPRGAEPLPENLSDLSQQVRRYRADIGFAQDPDADRLAVVNEEGRPVGEEYTIAMVSEHLLSKEQGPVVINLSTTKAVDDIAVRYGVECIRAKVGEINVVEEMQRRGARIGGEGNGGVISPEVHYGRDSLAGIAYILEMLAQRDTTVSQIVNDLPAYVMKKGKVAYNPARFDKRRLDRIKKKHRGERITETDGLRIEFRKNTDFKQGWVHLRPSNTEPIFRIIAEGTDDAQARAIYRYFSDLLK
ncbi:MAG: phosphoglucosamine mutase [Spirochaetes bacterium]|nr:phosphoglucosamine mutase [Spirochaetota bacterium]